MIWLYVLGALALLAVGMVVHKKTKSHMSSLEAGDPSDPKCWDLRTIARGIMKSKGFEKHPAKQGDWIHIHFDAGDDLHYAVCNPGDRMKGAKGLQLDYRFVFSPGARLYPTNPPGSQNSPTMLTLLLQHEDDNFLANQYKNDSEDDRWWGTMDTVNPMEQPEGTIVSMFDERWTATQFSTADDNQEGLRDVIENCGRIGFSLGGGDGYGHGCTATGPIDLYVKLTILK